MSAISGEITRLLNKVRAGDRDAEDKVMSLVYEELHRRAANYMRKERPNHTLQPTALVHEAYFRLVHHRGGPWQNRSHFYALAANAMRRILVDYARGRNADKRAGGEKAVPLDDALVFSVTKSYEILALDEALDRLAQLDPRQARIVVLRYFGGLSIDDTAAIIDVSPTQVKREWAVAKAWLHAELTKHA